MTAREVRDEIERIIRMHMLRLTVNEAEVDIVAPTATAGVCEVIGLPPTSSGEANQ